MTDTETNGSVVTGNPEATIGAVEATNGSNAETNAAGPFAALSEDKRDWVGKKGFQSMDALVTSYQEVEKWQGRAIPLPGEDAKPEEWDKVWTRLGRPEKPEGYELAPPDTMPDTMPYDQGFADAFKTAAHKAGLPKAAAKSLHDWFVETSVSSATKQAQASVDKANAELRTAWGDPNSDTYKANLKLADRGIQALGGDALMGALKRTGLLGPQGEVLDASIAKAFALAGKSMAMEGEFVTGGGTGGADNPFMTGRENLTEQMRLYKADPVRAMAMIRAAGRNPSDFGIRG